MAETTHTEWRRDQLSWTAEFCHCLPFNSSALYYLQTPTWRYGHASTTLQFLPISGDRDVSLPPSLEWHVWSSSSGNNCHAVHRSLSFTLSHIVSQAVFYSPDLAPCDFCLFPKLRGCRYETTEAIKEVTDTLTQEDFNGAFQKLLERYKCIATGGDYLEGDKSLMCVLSIEVPTGKTVWKLI